MNRIRLFILIGLLLLLFSCGGTKVAKLTNDVNQITENLNSIFSNIAEPNDLVAEEAKALFKKLQSSSDEFDISTMDEVNGGRFYFFKDKLYVKKYDKDIDECALFNLGAKPLTDANKRVLVLFSKLNDSYMKLVKENPYISRTGIFTKDSDALLYPNVDVISGYPPGLDLNIFPWFQDALASTETEYWYKPVINAGLTGITCSYYNIIKLNNEFQAMQISTIYLLKIMEDALADTENMIFVAFEDTGVFGATATLKQNIPSIKVTEQFDYTEQIKGNPEFSEEFKLSYKANSDGIKALGALILAGNVGTEGLSVAIDNTNYSVVLNSVPEAKFYVVGLVAAK